MERDDKEGMEEEEGKRIGMKMMIIFIWIAYHR